MHRRLKGNVFHHAVCIGMEVFPYLRNLLVVVLAASERLRLMMAGKGPKSDELQGMNKYDEALDIYWYSIQEIVHFRH